MEIANISGLQVLKEEKNDQMKHTEQNQASWRGPGEGHLVL